MLKPTALHPARPTSLTKQNSLFLRGWRVRFSVETLTQRTRKWARFGPSLASGFPREGIPNLNSPDIKRAVEGGRKSFQENYLNWVYGGVIDGRVFQLTAVCSIRHVTLRMAR